MSESDGKESALHHERCMFLSGTIVSFSIPDFVDVYYNANVGFGTDRLLRESDYSDIMTTVIYDCGHYYNRGELLLREVRKKKVMETITEVAFDLFKQKGYEHVTVEEIALGSGIAKGTFFNYFQKKEHLLLHLANSYSQLMDQIVQRHREGTIKERLLHILRDILSIYLQHSDLLSLTLVETIRSTIETKEQSTNLTMFREALRTLLEEAIRSGALRSRWDPDMSASVIVGLFLNTLIHGSSSLNEDELYEVLHRQLDAVWEGIADE
jgi:AcrR family transcriptional regulator